MLDAGWQIWLGLFLVGVVVYFLLEGPQRWERLAQRLAVLPSEPIDDAARLATTERLAQAYPNLHDDAVTSLLLCEAKQQNENEFGAIKHLEIKAAAEIVLVAVGIGLLTLIEVRSGNGVALSPWLVIALTLSFISVLANAVCFWPSAYRPPSVEVYNALATGADAALKAPIQLELTEALLRYGAELQVVETKKARWLGGGSVLLIVALLMLLLNLYGGALSHARTMNPNCLPTTPDAAVPCRPAP